MTTKTTTTEALAEIRTIVKRLESKQDFIVKHITRPEALRDPFEKEDGGSFAVIGEEMQSFRDLTDRILKLRRAIRKSNEETLVTVSDKTMSVADWLEWKREVAPLLDNLLGEVAAKIHAARENASRRPGQSQAWPPSSVSQAAESLVSNVVVNLDEKTLAEQIEIIQHILGTLDGQLSLKNATVIIEVED